MAFKSHTEGREEPYRERCRSDGSELAVIVGDAKASSAGEEKRAADSWPHSTAKLYTHWFPHQGTRCRLSRSARRVGSP